MAWRPHGRARVSARNPEAFGICDRCNFLYNLVDLEYQLEWTGIKLRNTRLRVCCRCMDEPQEQLRTRVLGPDPLPVRDPRPDPNLAPTEAAIQLQVGDGSVPPLIPPQSVILD